jgi:hypothetical protein
MSVTSDNLLRQIVALLGGTPPENGEAASNDRISVTTGTIANGDSLSAAVDLAGGRLAAIVMPADWTTAALSFQGSPDGVIFSDVFDGSAERSISSSDMAAMVGKLDIMDPTEWGGIEQIKLRSGLTGAAVNQGAERSFTIVIVKG